jgi:hypothetical protein
VFSLLFPIYLVDSKSDSEIAAGPKASKKFPTIGSLEERVYPTDSIWSSLNRFFSTAKVFECCFSMTRISLYSGAA